MSENKNIEYFPPHPLLKLVVQYVVGIIAGALVALIILGFLVRGMTNEIAEHFLFLLIATSLLGGILGGWMVFLKKLEKRRDKKKIE